MKDYCRIKNRTSKKLGLYFAVAYRMRVRRAAAPSRPADATPNAGAAAAGASPRVPRGSGTAIKPPKPPKN
eukprot:2545580-Amphidinium_carterae.1